MLSPSRGSLWASMGSLILTMFLAAIDQTVVATAMPTIVGELHGLDSVSWLVTAFALTSAIATPLYGKLSDMYGRKNLYLSAIVVFVAGSALCGLAQSMGQLVAFRALQGIGAGGLMVLNMTIVGDLVTPRERARFQGIFGAVFTLATVAGPILGGYLTEHVSWRWIFYINLPLGAIALAVAFAVLKLPKRVSPHRIDWSGAVLISGLLTCLTLLASWGGTVHAWSSPVILALGAGSVLLAVLFVLVERAAAEPVLPLRLFRDGTFTIPVAAVVLLATAMLGAATFLPMFLQLAGGASAADSGLLLLPLMGGMAVSSTLVGQLVHRFGRYKWFMVIGAALAGIAGLLFATMDLGTSGRVHGALRDRARHGPAERDARRADHHAGGRQGSGDLRRHVRQGHRRGRGRGRAGRRLQRPARRRAGRPHPRDDPGAARGRAARRAARLLRRDHRGVRVGGADPAGRGHPDGVPEGPAAVARARARGRLRAGIHPRVMRSERQVRRAPRWGPLHHFPSEISLLSCIGCLLTGTCIFCGTGWMGEACGESPLGGWRWPPWPCSPPARPRRPRPRPRRRPLPRHRSAPPPPRAPRTSSSTPTGGSARHGRPSARPAAPWWGRTPGSAT
ncbi:MFS transporter [Nonomuraea phyllanthi]|uniref:MFS transporter n=1 Tax=Nonomuraea phyllanthi TaxID=2219224 RepID=A0A5C4V9D5_9ACTN|nr:MFS transporter [Nonomuraea phyllanthi]